MADNFDIENGGHFGIDPELFRQFMTWRERTLSVLTETGENCNNFCMVGRIRTKEKCPRCGKKFIDTGKALVCQKCLTTPDRFYIDIYHKGKQFKIYSDMDGKPLSSYKLASDILTPIREKIRRRTFDPKDYVSTNIKALAFDRNIRAWLDRQGKRLKRDEIAPSYHQKLDQYVNNYFIPFFKSRDVRDIRTKDIEDFHFSLPETLSPKTAKNIMYVLQKYFNDLFDRDEIKTKPKFPRIATAEPHTHWADADLQDAIYEKIPERHRPIFSFLKETGCRPGEARAIWREDVNLTEQWVIIRRAFSEDVYREITKSKRQRIIPIDGGLIDTIKNLPVIKGFLFLDEYGKPYTRCHLWRIYNRAKKEAGIEVALSLYEWSRHSFASQAVNRGVPENIIGAFLGHADSRVTKKYAHMNLDGMRIALPKNRGTKIFNLRPKQAPDKPQTKNEDEKSYEKQHVIER